jgi:hypothetical protein
MKSLSQNEMKVKAERNAMTAGTIARDRRDILPQTLINSMCMSVIAQKKLTALLDSQLESVDNIAKHSQSELTELRQHYEQVVFLFSLESHL